MCWNSYRLGIVAKATIFSIAFTLSATSLAVTQIPLPRTSGYLRVLVNVNQALPAYAAYLGAEVIITDLEYQAGLNSSVPDYATVRSWVGTQYPALPVGVYFSSRAIIDASLQEFTPPNSMAADQFAANELLPPQFLDHGRPIVDYRQPAARGKLVTGTLQLVQTYPTQWLYSDNWSHASTWAGYIGWADTINYMKELRAALATQGVGLICNVAVEPSSVSTADLTSLGTSCDGVSLEMFALPNVTKDAKALTKLVAGYQALLATGCRVILMPDFPTIEKGRAEARFAAGLAMILDGPYVSFAFWQPQQDWFKWPAQMGKPVGVVRQGGTKLWRDFEHGTITIDGVKRTVTLAWKRFYKPTSLRLEDARLRPRIHDVGPRWAIVRRQKYGETV